jgi:ferredoxin
MDALSYAVPDEISIVYFTGTGCTGLAAATLAGALRQRGISTKLSKISVRTPQDRGTGDGMLLLLFPVYAFNAPGPVYTYIRELERGCGRPAAVISVSGGGEVSPNTACRSRVNRMLERKGYRVVYERMLVMPSNALAATPFEAGVMLLRALPEKVDCIADAVLSGTVRRTSPRPGDRILAPLGGFERYGAKLFGKGIKFGSTCNGCGICWQNCPTGNIKARDNRPVFGTSCATCLKCLYDCPQKALSPRFGKTLLLKEGFSLAAFQKSAAQTRADNSALPEGLLWDGIKAYLQETDT